MESIDLGSIEKEGKILNVVVKYQRVGGKMGISAQVLTVLNSPFCLLRKDKISFGGFKGSKLELSVHLYMYNVKMTLPAIPKVEPT